MQKKKEKNKKETEMWRWAPESGGGFSITHDKVIKGMKVEENVKEKDKGMKI